MATMCIIDGVIRVEDADFDFDTALAIFAAALMLVLAGAIRSGTVTEEQALVIRDGTAAAIEKQVLALQEQFLGYALNEVAEA